MFRIDKFLLVTIVLGLSFLVVSCKVDVEKSSDKEITSYWFTSSKNLTLSETIKCSISNTDITCSTPYGTDVTGLIATFQQTGEKVRVGNTEQTSGSTANDFSSPVTYTVIAEDDSTQGYEVTVNVAAASDKTINSFEFLAENNTALSSDVTGTVYENNRTIGASVPSGTDVTALCPTIGYSGDSVSPGNEVDTDFSNAVTYTVTAADGTTQDYEATVNVIADNPDTADTEAPTSPTISINSGASSTTSTSVTLSLSASDDVGVVGYYASESSTAPSAGSSGWASVASATNYSGSVSFTLSSGTATKTVYVWFMDNAGNVSTVSNDSIDFADLSTSLTVHYIFNNDVSDESVNGNDGTLTGGGYTSGSLQLDGIDDQVAIPRNVVDDVATGTWSIWLKPSSISNNAGANFYAHGQGYDNGFSDFKLYNGDGQVRFSTSNTREATITGSSIFSVETWYNVVVTYNGSSVYLYVNDNLVGSATATGTIESNNYDIRLGMHAQLTFGYEGLMDGFAFWANRVLNASERTVLYNEGQYFNILE